MPQSHILTFQNKVLIAWVCSDNTDEVTFAQSSVTSSSSLLFYEVLNYYKKRKEP